MFRPSGYRFADKNMHHSSIPGHVPIPAERDMLQSAYEERTRNEMPSPANALGGRDVAPAASVGRVGAARELVGTRRRCLHELRHAVDARNHEQEQGDEDEPRHDADRVVLRHGFRSPESWHNSANRGIVPQPLQRWLTPTSTVGDSRCACLFAPAIILPPDTQL